MQADLTFIAENVPSMGYDTYYIKTDAKAEPDRDTKFASQYENAFYRVTFGPGGLSGLFDKALQKDILNTQGLQAGDVFVMESIGNGAGEFAAVQQPDMKGFDKTSNHPVQWELAEDGDVYTLFKYRQRIKDAVIEQNIKLYKSIRRIDFNPSIKNWDGTLYREYRMALPVGISQARLTYEVPFGAVEIGKDELKEPAGERYMTIPSEIHPRGMENWVNASGKDFGITMSSSVAAFDFKDVTGLAKGATLLQPILLASRKSCHPEGNEYLQTGDHDYFFSITTDKPGTGNSFRFGKQANEELRAVVNPETYADASLPERASFVSVSTPDVIITAFKKAEEGNAVVMRFYETAGKDTDAEFTFHTKFRKAVATSLIEEDGKEIPMQDGRLKVHVSHNSIETIKLFR
jgi:alpha-mannosidase